jgi:phage terminase Nu1 subunit (DNA packaging protein)
MKAGEIANILGITESHMRILVQEGYIPKENRGEYDPEKCKLAYIVYLQEIERKRNEAASDNINSKDERTRLVKARADKSELKYKTKYDDYVELDAFCKELENFIKLAKQKILSLEPALTDAVLKSKTRAEIQANTYKIIHKTLNELAELQGKSTHEED